MEKQIVKIHLKDYFRFPGETPENISSVQLVDGTIKSVPQVALEISRGDIFFYTVPANFNDHTEVETLRSSSGNLYIRTKANNNESDNLLSLPRF